VTALVALLAALSSRAFAAPIATAHLDPARMFNPMAESLLADLFAPSHNALPMDFVLFGDGNRAIASLPSPLPIPNGAAIVAAVNLHAYTPPATLPSQPLQAPSVAPAVPARAQLAQAPAPAITAPAAVRFGSYAPYEPRVQRINESVQVPVRVGPVHFAGVVSGAQTQTQHADAIRAMQLCGTTDEASACPYLHDEHAQNLTAGTNFNVRAGNTQVSFQLSGSVGRVTNRDAMMYHYAPLDPDTQLDPTNSGPQDSAMLYYPGLSDVVRHGLNARLAVPISPAVTLGLQYNRAYYQGDYSSLLAPGMDARKDTYLGNVTYQLPNSSSLLTLSARQYRYQDSFAPNFNLTQTRADLSFTVKF
jgi:hypothetical protein